MEQTSTTQPIGFVASVAAVCLVVIFVTLQMASPSASTAPPPLTEIELRALAQQATLRVSANTCGRVTRGSGFIADGHMLTNAHVVEGAAELKADQPIDPVVLPLVGMDRGSDLAASEQPAGVSLTFALDGVVAAPAGLEVVLAGHADGDRIEVQNGVVSARVPGGAYGYSTDVLLIDAETRGGYSGGPVLDRSGSVVGVLSGFDRSTGLTLAVPVDVVRDFVDSHATRVADRGLVVSDCGTR